MSEGKFKVGDRVIAIITNQGFKFGDIGTVLSCYEGIADVQFDRLSNCEFDSRRFADSSQVILLEVYNSPLYQALL